jgi:PAS domain S-box-containing protein
MSVSVPAMEQNRTIKTGLPRKTAAKKNKLSETYFSILPHKSAATKKNDKRAKSRSTLQRSETRWSEGEEPFQMLVSMVTEGILIHENGIIMDANQAFAAIAGISTPKMLVGKNIYDLLPFSDESYSAYQEAMTIENPEPGNISAKYPDGRTLQLLIRSRAVILRGRMATMVVILDITEHHRFEEELKSLQQQLTQAHELEEIGRHAIKVAHDFNNHLTTIIGYAELILSKISAGDPFHTEMKEILKVGERSAVMTHELMELMRKHDIPKNSIPSKSSGQETILLVEDKEAGHRRTRPFLKRLGYHFLEADSITEAIRICSEYSNPIHLLLADVVLQGMSGIELYDNLREIRTEMKALFMSDDRINTLPQCGLPVEESAWIKKPFNENDLMNHLRNVLDHNKS